VIQHVTRADDPRIADFADVGDHDRLRARGLFVAEGRLVVRRLIESPTFPIESVAVTPAALSQLDEVLVGGRFPVRVCPPELLRQVTGFNFHRGCLALARRPAEQPPIARLAGARRLLALEGIGNPDNIGGLFRVAAALDAGGVLLGPGCADPFYRKSIRTSMGAVLRVPFANAASWTDDLNRLRAAGMLIVALTPAVRATPLRELAATLDAGARLALMFGAEGPGLTEEALRAADLLARIPMAPGVDALNVAVAAGIALALLDRG
jgi:tRNA G18 (ribose-2'-O)-methylase SpoU